MENKYYTPTIEEFHVGFEYEEFCYGGGSVEKSWWHKTVKHSDLEWDRDGNTGCYNTDSIDMRVKFLDKEDIESLGWKHDDKFYDTYDYGERWLLIHNIGFNRVELSDNENENGFSGTIKNKSELKRLMNQLGITQP